MSVSDRRIRAEMHADLATVRAELARLVATIEIAGLPVPAAVAGVITPEQWAVNQRRLLDEAAARARTTLATPTWLSRVVSRGDRP